MAVLCWVCRYLGRRLDFLITVYQTGAIVALALGEHTDWWACFAYACACAGATLLFQFVTAGWGSFPVRAAAWRGQPMSVYDLPKLDNVSRREFLRTTKGVGLPSDADGLMMCDECGEPTNARRGNDGKRLCDDCCERDALWVRSQVRRG